MASMGSASGGSPPRSPRRSAEHDAANQLAQDIDAARQMSRARLNSQAPMPHHLHQQTSALAHARQSSSTSTVHSAGASNNFSSNLVLGADETAEPSQVDLAASATGSASTVTTPGVQSASAATAPLAIPDASPVQLRHDASILNISPSRQFNAHPHQGQQGQGQQGHHPHSAGGLYAHSHMQGSRGAPRSPSAAAAAANLTYFYRHNRHGSNTSLDSSQHFIDHRQQPHSLSLNPHSPVLNRAPSSSHQQHGRSPVAFRRGFFDQAAGGGSNAATPVDGDASAIQVESPMGGPSAYRPSPSGPLIDITADGTLPRRRPSAAQRSTHSGQSGRDGQDGGNGTLDAGVMYGEHGSPHTMSRRPSMLEDDVCFPMMTNQGDASVHPHAFHDEHAPQDPSYLPHTHPHQAYEDHHHHHAPGVGEDAMRLPPGFPFTFDMQTLEEFASEERERVRSSAVTDPYQPVLDGSAQQHQGAVPISATGNNAASGLRNRLGRSSIPGPSAANLYGASPDSDDASFYVRKPKKMPTAAASGSHVAGVFNTYHQPARASPRLQGQDSSSNLYATAAGDNKAKMPLLEGNNGGLPSYTSQGGDAGPSGDARSTKSAKAAMARSQSHVAMSAAAQDSLGQRGRSGSTPGGGSLPTGAALYAAQQLQSQQERPYRFTFYSNTLPSTIHARYLSEIPAPGQTFEELFSGRKPANPSPTPPETGVAGTSSIPGTNGLDGSTAVGHPNGASTDAPAAAGGVGGAVPLSRPSSVLPNAGGAPLPLPAHLLQQTQSGNRMEGNTAPPTGANTPILAQHALAPAPSRAGALGLNTANAAAGGAATPVGPPSAAASRAGGVGRVPSAGLANLGTGVGNGAGAAAAAAAAVARTYPGGGLRMDQDADANTWWLDVLCPTDAEMKLLSRVFGVHPLTTEDILMEETREKIELFRNYFLVCFRSFDQDPHSPTYLEPVNMYIIVFREGTLSFHFHPTPHPQNVRRRIKQLKDYISVTSDWISYALIDDITDAFGPLIQNIEYEVDSIDELVLILKDVEQSDMLRRIGTCRKKVMGLLRLMGNKADVVKGLAKRCNENWSVAPKSDIGLYLSDIQDHLITMTQNLNHYEKILSRSHSNYLAQISIEMTDANNQINDVLSKLTALGTIIVPMNVITGLWGMNVNVPGQGVENLHWFAGICAVLAFLAISGYYATIRYLQRS
ncbi:CorA metal ion transporter [Tilletia horrida]|nr:CorA metal ion transporter [Tilletia horrida]